MRFLGYTLIEKMVVLPQIFSAYIAISKKDINLFAVQHGDTEGIVNYPLSIHKIKFAALITERNEEEVKFSFRSKGNFDVNFIAKTYFNGGGHFNAAGGTLNTNFEEAIAYFNKILSDIHPQ